MQPCNHLFEAFLKCPTKCWLLSRGEASSGNEYPEWVKAQDEAYRTEGLRRLRETVFSDSRDSEIARATRAEFHGVLVSDFYSGYDSLACPQQKCLLHLMRDLNADILRHPFDEGLKRIVSGFARLLQEIVDTIDRFGLRRHFLHKHRKSVDWFYREIKDTNLQSEPAVKCKQRLEGNRGKLFTFLDHDGVSWNNNNAEHAIKAFCRAPQCDRGLIHGKGY